jgi:phosphoribosylaminoimidazole carboxylase (NCAIR synthetase)
VEVLVNADFIMVIESFHENLLINELPINKHNSFHINQKGGFY